MAAPANDNFADAQLLTGLTGSVSGTTVDATKEVGEVDAVSDWYWYYWSDFRSVWYKWVAPVTGIVRFVRTGIDNKIAIRTGASVDALVTVADSYYKESVAALVESGTEYYIWVASTVATPSAFDLTWEALAAPVYENPTYLPLPARLDPFPYSEFFIDWSTVEADALIYARYNDSSNDAVQFNVVFGADLAAWQHPESAVGVGLARDANDYTGEYFPSAFEGGQYYSTWNGQVDIDDLMGVQRHVFPYQKSGDDGPALPSATVSLPGVSGIVLYNGYTLLEPVWLNSPLSYEAWFSENPYKVTPERFTGYTSFGDQRATFYMPYYGPSDAYVRKMVYGILNRSAVLSTCTVADIRFGFIVTYDGTKTYVDVAYNGDSLWHYEFVGKLDGANNDFYFNLETAYRGYIEDFAGDPVGALDSAYFSLYTTSGTIDSPSYTTYAEHAAWETQIPCFDTYDVKWAWYADVFSPTLPVGEPYIDGYGDPEKLYAYTPDMRTLLGREYATPPPPPDFWTYLVDAREVD